MAFLQWCLAIAWCSPERCDKHHCSKGYIPVERTFGMKKRHIKNFATPTLYASMAKQWSSMLGQPYSAQSCGTGWPRSRCTRFSRKAVRVLRWRWYVRRHGEPRRSLECIDKRIVLLQTIIKMHLLMTIHFGYLCVICPLLLPFHCCNCVLSVR